MIAQDFARKGLATAIKATALLDVKRAGTRVVLLVVGKQEAGRFADLARDQRVGDRVIFAGSTSDPYAFYRAAEMFVLPTRHDPCSLVVLESLAMGVPVISTRFNGACEIMENGRHGFVLDDPGDEVALADAMARLCEDDFRSGASMECLKLREQLSFDAHVAKLESIYELVMSRRGVKHV